MSGCSVTQGDAEPALTEVASLPAWAICKCDRVSGSLVAGTLGSRKPRVGQYQTLKSIL